MKNSKFKITMTFFGCILILSAIANVYALTLAGTPVYQLLTSAGLIITACLGAVYLLSGFSKQKSARFFVWFMGMYALTEWFGVIGARNNVAVNMLLLVLSFGCAFTLTVAKDLGKVKSFTLSIIIMVSVAARIVISYFTTGMTAFGIRPVTKLLLSAAVLTLVSAKYYDKRLRNTR